MVSASVYDKKAEKRRGLSRFSKYSNRSMPVAVVVVALALLSVVLEKRSESRYSTSGKSTESEVFVDKPQDNTSHARQKTPPPLTWQFVSKMKSMISTFNDAFHDPVLIAYANEQGADLPGSPTTSLPNTSGQPAAPAKSLSTQSTRFPRRY